MSLLSQYLSRSAQVFKESTKRMVLMKGADLPCRAPRTLFTFNSQDDIDQFATGCDADIGGTSTVHLERHQNEKEDTSMIGGGRRGGARGDTGVFWGDMRLGVKAGLEGKVRGGYAGFRNKKRPTLFGDMMEDVSQHEFLTLRLRLGGDPATHNAYFCNIQTDGPFETDLWQHRLFFKRRDGGWEDIYIPFTSFVRTNSGELYEDQIEIDKERIRSVGISLLGGMSGVAGRYELGIDSIGIINEEHIEPITRGRESSQI